MPCEGLRLEGLEFNLNMMQIEPLYVRRYSFYHSVEVVLYGGTSASHPRWTLVGSVYCDVFILQCLELVDTKLL